MNLYKYASPTSFYPLAGKMIPWFAIPAAILFLVGLYVGFFVAPTDAQQGDAYRLRACRELARDWRRAKRDADIARAFYRRIEGFNESDRHLQELTLIHAPAPRKSRTRRSYRWR